MTKTTIVGSASVLLLLGIAAALRDGGHDGDLVAATISEAAETGVHQGLLYGRVTDVNGVTYEGRLRFGGDEEVLWGHYFNGTRDENPWFVHVPAAQLASTSDAIEVFGMEITSWERRHDLERPFMVRFGDLSRIEARGRNLWAVLKSGAVVELDRFAADDFADGIRVWDTTRGVVDLDEWRLHTIEFLPAPAQTGGPAPLYGTVRTANGDFTGYIQWNREESLGVDMLDGETGDGAVSLPFATIRSIARRSNDRALVTLVDGRELELSDSREIGQGSRGIYVDDPRFGRVLVSWEAFESARFAARGNGPAYGDYGAGEAIVGSVTTRGGARLEGRLVFDLDESETTETLDAPSRGVDYTIPFALVASIDLPGRDALNAPVTVTLRDGGTVRLERSGDLSDTNAGMLIFADDGKRPEYVPWAEVERVEYSPTATPAPLPTQ